MRVDYNPAAIKNRSDFVGIYKYKVMLLVFMMAIWIFIVASYFDPVLFHILQTTNVVLMSLILIKMFVSVKNTIIGYSRANAIMDRIEGKTSAVSRSNQAQLSQLMHVFIIPSYKEEEDVFF